MRARFIVGVLGLAAAGCGLFGGDKDMKPADIADLSGIPPGSDLAMFLNSAHGVFRLRDNFHDQGVVNCNDPRVMVTMVTFTTVEQANGAMATTSMPCPSGQDWGEGDIALSNSKGLFNVTASSVGGVMRTSQVYKDLSPGSGLNAEIYVLQNDM